MEILNIAERYGSLTIKRPKKYSGDTATTESAVVHCLKTIKKKYDYVIILEPTNPLKKKSDIDNAIKYTVKNNFNSVFSGTKLIDFLIWKKK